MRIGDFHIYAKTVLSHGMLTHVYVDDDITPSATTTAPNSLVLTQDDYSETITFKTLSAPNSDTIFELLEKNTDFKGFKDMLTNDMQKVELEEVE